MSLKELRQAFTRAGRRLGDTEGMTKEDWRRVWMEYQFMLARVRLIVAEVEARKGGN